MAALVQGNQIYVPLRSMFEQMGARVSTSDGGRTITATKSDASVSVTVGRNEVIVNGESRPLDVPPIIYRGIVLVPVRVISEALGAYVQWVPGQRVVVVRYLPPTAAPIAPPEPEPQPSAAPPAPVAAPPVPTATPEPASNRGFIEGAFAAPKNYNEFSRGQYCPEQYVLNAAYVFPHSPFAVKVDYREDAYVTSDNYTDVVGNHYTRFGTIDGGIAFTPVFLAHQSTLDARLEYQVAAPRIYVGLSYLHATTSYEYPQLSAAGVGLEKLPDFRSLVSVYGSAFYYPSATGTYTVTDPASSNVGRSYVQRYGIVKYDVGVAVALTHFPVYVYGGFNGDRYGAKGNAPLGQTHDGPYLGLGAKL